NVDVWQSLGFDAIARHYLERLVLAKGASAALAENGDLLLQWRGATGPDRHSLLGALASPTRPEQPTAGTPRGKDCAPFALMLPTRLCSRLPQSPANGPFPVPSYSPALTQARSRARRELNSAAAFLALIHLAGRP